MSDKTLDFEIVCPNTHNQTVTFSHKEFDAALKTGTLEFHCNTCEANWNPSREELNRFRKEFAKSSV